LYIAPKHRERDEWDLMVDNFSKLTIPRKVKIQLVKGSDISSRHRGIENFQDNIKFVCRNTLKPNLTRLGVRTDSDSFCICPKNNISLLLRWEEPTKVTANIKDVEEEIKKATEITGLNDWIKGKSGWRFSSIFSTKREQKSTLIALNKLQDVFKVCSSLFKMDSVRYIYNKKEILRKSDDICDTNHDIRNLCEILIAIDKDPKERPCKKNPNLLEISDASKVRLKEKNLYKMTVEQRWSRVIKTVYALMRNSHNIGPSSAIQWAAHPPRNRYERVVVTKDSQEQVVLAMVCITRNIFWGKAHDTSIGMGVGDVWFNSTKRRKSDWVGSGENLKDFETPDNLRKLLNREY